MDADVCDALIEDFRGRLEAMQRDATDLRRQFDTLHRRWLAHIERRDRR